MDAKGHNSLKNVPEVSDISAASAANAPFFKGITLEGGLTGQNKSHLFLAVDSGITFAIPFDGILSLREIEEDIVVPGMPVSIRVKAGTQVTSSQVLEVGKDIVAPEAKVSAFACPSQCTQPVQCGAGCCCGGKKCQGRSCV